MDRIASTGVAVSAISKRCLGFCPLALGSIGASAGTPGGPVRSLDKPLVISLWVFLLVFLAYLVISVIRQRRRFSREAPEAGEDLPGWSSSAVRVRAALFAMALSALVFAYLCFAPSGGLPDFAAAPAQPPLRLTWLNYQRTTHGFKLEGDIWNQSEKTLRNVRTTVLALDASGKRVGQANGMVSPADLQPGGRGRFVVSCEQPAAEATNCDLRFMGDQNTVLAYVRQFPPTRVSLAGGE